MTLRIKIGDKNIPEINISPNDRFVAPLTYSMLLSKRQKKLPINIICLTDNDITDNVKLYFEKDSDLVNSLHSLLGGNFTLNISIHLIIKENGFIIGFLATGFKPLKYLIRYNEISKNTSCNTCKEINYLKAKSVFLNSFSEFSELIQTDSLKKSLYKEKWIEKISLIDQEGHLMDLFKQNADNFGDWFQLLKSWGLKSDQCKQIPGAIVNKNLYDIVEQMSTIEDCMYEVIQPCWTIWIDSNGTRQEKLVAKGLLKKI